MIDTAAPGLVIDTGSKLGVTQPPANTANDVSKALRAGVRHATAPDAAA